MRVKVPKDIPVNTVKYWDYRFKQHIALGFRRVDLPGFDMIAGKIKDHDRVLEVGCGMGEYLQHVSKVKPTAELFGSDISFVAAAECQKRIPDLAWTNDITIYEDGYFNVIFCIHTLEHVEDPGVLLKELKRLLKPSGWLVIVLPYLDRPWHEHHKIWGKPEIKELFNEFDCEVEIVIRNATNLGEDGKIFIKGYEDGIPFQEAVCFVRFKNV